MKISSLKKIINEKLNIISLLTILENIKQFLKLNIPKRGRNLSSTSLKLSPLNDNNMKTTLCPNNQMITENKYLNNQGELKKIALNGSDVKFNM